MQILVSDPSYADWNGDLTILQRDLHEGLAEIGEFDLSRTDIGPGADWPMFLAVFSSIGAVFLLGDKIEKNLDAWVSIGRRLKTGVAKLQKKVGATRIDETGAQLLLLERLATAHHQLRSVKLLVSQTVPIHQFQGRPAGALDSRYDALYVFVILVNEEQLVVAGVRSSGEIDFVRRYGADFMTFGEPATNT